MALKKDEGDGVPLVVAVQRLFELSVVEPVADDEDDRDAAPAAEVREESKKVAGR
jgi:hypothetical protein